METSCERSGSGRQRICMSIYQIQSTEHCLQELFRVQMGQAKPPETGIMWTSCLCGALADHCRGKGYPITLLFTVFIHVYELYASIRVRTDNSRYLGHQPLFLTNVDKQEWGYDISETDQSTKKEEDSIIFGRRYLNRQSSRQKQKHNLVTIVSATTTPRQSRKRTGA